MRFLEPKVKELIGETPYKLDYVNGQRKVIIHTDRIDNEKLEAIKNAFTELGTNIIIKEEQYNHHIEISWRNITVYLPPEVVNKYDHCTTVNEIVALNPDYQNDLTSDGGWGYALFNLKSAGGLFDGDKLLKHFGLKVLPNVTSTNNMFRHSSIEKLTLSLPKVDNFSSTHMHNATGFCAFATKLQRAEIIIPIAKHQNEAFEGCLSLESVIIKDTKSGIINKICQDCPKLSYFWIDAPEITQAFSAFRKCILNKESALHILQKLATYTDGAEHLITIGIHIDRKYDPNVNLALKKADINYEPTVELPEEVTEGKGWTLTVQWNGTPTSTASTFVMGTLIYAKAGEMERPDGTIERYLDWGHYVTKWEERGYEQFRSLESAYEYFGLEIPKEEIEI